MKATAIMKRANVLALATTVAFTAFGMTASAQETAPEEAAVVDHAAEVAALGGDAKKGKRVFQACRACHKADKEKNMTGPHLVGIFGRTAGTVEKFKYSDVNRDSGIVWTVETLTPYLLDPKGNMPGTKMNFKGVKEEKLADLFAYLYETSGETKAE